MTSIAIILARNGSKGLKDKNNKLMNGKPLIAYSIESAKTQAYFMLCTFQQILKNM